MGSHLCLTLRLLDGTFHGRMDGGEPEWPPSPLRMYQATVASLAAKHSGQPWPERVRSALDWLASQPPPIVVANQALKSATKYRLYVPDNVTDKVASSWAAGRPASIADYRTEKDVRPMRVAGEAAIHYLFPLPSDSCDHLDLLRAAARSITHLGWGVDMVVGDATIVTEDEAASLAGEHWHPDEAGGGQQLRSPVQGTLDDLIRKHEAFLQRLGPDGFKPVPPLSAFRVVGYRRSTDPSPLRWAAFELFKADLSGRRAFDPCRRTRCVAGMTRHVVDEAAEIQGWDEAKRTTFVHGKMPTGKSPTGGYVGPDRFHYLPLPTINAKLRRVESTRRVLIAAPSNCRNEIAWAKRSLAGMELVDDAGEIQAVLNILPSSDWVLGRYVAQARDWATVTPVILPGYDDPKHLRRKLKTCGDAAARRRYLDQLHQRVAGLLRKALTQAGYASELVARCQLDWCAVGFHAGVDLANRYLPPENLSRYSRYHVRVRFPVEIVGPVSVGSGRFRGFGLFAALTD